MPGIFFAILFFLYIFWKALGELFSEVLDEIALKYHKFMIKSFFIIKKIKVNNAHISQKNGIIEFLPLNSSTHEVLKAFEYNENFGRVIQRIKLPKYYSAFYYKDSKITFIS